MDIFSAESSMSQPRDAWQKDLFRPALEQIVDMAESNSKPSSTPTPR